jgi:hypothetical protein
MKLQLENQHLRVRINEDELSDLLRGETVVALTWFADAFAHRATLRLDQVDKPGLGGKPEDWLLTLPDRDVRELSARLPTREGLHYQLPGSKGGELELLFDVDVRDSTRRRHATRA